MRRGILLPGCLHQCFIIFALCRNERQGCGAASPFGFGRTHTGQVGALHKGCFSR